MKKLSKTIMISLLCLFLSTSTFANEPTEEKLPPSETHQEETKIDDQAIDNNPSLLASSEVSIELKAPKAAYWTSEDVIFNTTILISEDQGQINNPVLELRIPKKYFETIDSSDFPGQIGKTTLITETEVIIRYMFPKITGGLTLTIPGRLVPVGNNGLSGLMPNNHELNITATITDDSNTQIASAISPLIKFKTTAVTIDLGSTQATLLSLKDGQTYFGGSESTVNPGYLSDDVNLLSPVRFSYVHNNLEGRNVGLRSFEKVVFTVDLPDTAFFDAPNSPGWVYDAVAKTATFTSTDVYFPTIAMAISPLPLLSLKFPNQKLNTLFEMKAKVEYTPQAMASQESVIVLEDSQMIQFSDVITKPYMVKTSNLVNGLLDEVSARSNDLEWTLKIENKSNTHGIATFKINDSELDPLLEYTKVAIPQVSSAIASGSIKVQAVDSLGVVTDLVLNHDINSSAIECIIPSGTVRLEVSEDGIFLLHQMKTITFAVFTKLADPSQSLIDIGITRLTNTAQFDIGFEQSNQTSSFVSNAILNVKKYNPSVGLRKEIVNQKNDYIVNDIIAFSTKVTMATNEQVKEGTILEFDQFIDILPIGLEYVEGFSHVRVSSFVTALDPITLNPTVVHNYLDTGRTALIWDLKSVEFKDITNVLYELPILTITYSTKINPLMKQADTENRIHLLWHNMDTVKPSESSLIPDNFDINDNGDFEELVLGANKSFKYNPPRIVLSSKYAQGSLDANRVVLGSKTELNETVEYQLEVFNNSNETFQDMIIVDVLPHVGDKFIDNQGIFHNRNSDFTMSLSEKIAVNSDFKISYSNDTPSTTLKDYVDNAQWTENPSDLTLVKGIKIELRPGKEVQIGETILFDLKAKAPKDLDILSGSRANNSYNFSSDRGSKFLSSNIVDAEIVQFSIKGRVVEDVNENSILEVSEPGFESVTVRLVNDDGTPAYDLVGNEIKTTTDSNGNYELKLQKGGIYQVEIITPKGHDQIPNGSEDDHSHIIVGTQRSDKITLDAIHSDIIINAGYTKVSASLIVHKVLKDPSGAIITEARPFDFLLEVNQVPYNGPVTIDSVVSQVSNGEISITNGQAFEVLNLEGLSDIKITEMNADAYDTIPSSKIISETIVDPIHEYTFVNQVKSQKIDITGTKEWVNGPTTHPSIQVQLYQNGIAFQTPITLENGTTSHTWTNLDKTDNVGTPYVYTIDEVSVPENYQKSISSDGLTLTNTYQSPQTSITGTKVWIDGPAIHPSIQIQLYQNGMAYQTPITLENGTTSHTWFNLDKTDNEGVPYIYTIDEVIVPENYQKSISSDGLTLTNTYQSPQTSITGTKIWIDGPATHPIIQIQLYQNGIAYQTPITLESGTTSHTWSKLDKTDNVGVPYVYTIDEVSVPSKYTKTISNDGLTLTNTFVDDAPSVIDPGENKPGEGGGVIEVPEESLPQTGVSASHIVGKGSAMITLGFVLILLRKKRIRL